MDSEKKLGMETMLQVTKIMLELGMPVHLRGYHYLREAILMSIEDMEKAVELCSGKAETECSGNVTKENVAKLTRIGVNYISRGVFRKVM